MKPETYDADSETIPTAIRAIWLAFKRGQWELLRQLGLSRKEMEEPLRKFDATRLARDDRLVGKAQLYEAIQVYPPVVDAAIRLSGLYSILYRQTND